MTTITLKFDKTLTEIQKGLISKVIRTGLALQARELGTYHKYVLDEEKSPAVTYYPRETDDGTIDYWQQPIGM